MKSNTYLTRKQAGFYRLVCPTLFNHYYIVSDPGTCRLMASPEVAGFDSYEAMLTPTIKALEILKSEDSRGLGNVNILTILRGGLNYPVEEACHKCGITVSDMSFMSCERVIVNNEITGLDVKYEKLHTEDNCCLVIGDIVASGATLKLCFQHVAERFKQKGHSIRKIIFFTVGGTKAIDIMEDMTEKIKALWPTFEGFECVFYEGIFSVYSDNGVTGINVPDIDFGWGGGAISPEFRQYVLDYDYAPALLEKCIIYDGGARRYEIGEHAKEVIAYWEDLLKVSDSSDYEAFLQEKIGYKPCDYESWLEKTHLSADEDLSALFQNERDYIEKLRAKSLKDICLTRLSQLKNDFAKFLND
ncbi:MAG: hypothetical protein MJZ16_03600 [Bacteroidales bacterium]|nr:hypothetical protein [Bacteroidales bacterium]